MKTSYKVGVIILSMLMILAVGTLNVSAQDHKTKIAKIVKSLKEKAKKNRIRVIVEPDTDYTISDEKQRKKRAISRFKKLVSRFGINPSKEIKRAGLLVYEVNEQELDQIINAESVKSIGEDLLLEPHLAQSIPFINADIPHNSGYRGQNQTVAILDTGVDSSHPDLAPRVVEEACFSTNSQNSISFCPNGQDEQRGTGSAVNCGLSACNHGTHVAGIAAGRNGVAPEADIIAVQIFSEVWDSDSCKGNPPCALSYTSDIIAALDWVLNEASSPNIASVNMSIGGGRFTEYCDDRDAYKPVTELVRKLMNAGTRTVVSAGNNAFSDAVSFPGCVSLVDTVGSTLDTSNVISGFSNSALMVDLLAPGSSITSSIPGGGVATYSGTSMAAPHVTGSYALLRSVHKNANEVILSDALMDTGVSILDTNNQLSFPRIDLDAATLEVIDQANGINTTAFGASRFWHDWFAPNEEVPAVGDFNGDGLDDIVTFVSDSDGYIWTSLSNGSKFLKANLVKGGFAPNDEIPAVGDFNGDGLDDIISFTNDSRADVYVAFSNGSSFGEVSKWYEYFAPTGEIPAVGDFNGDGLDDIVTFTSNSTAYVWVALSNGSSFNRASVWQRFFAPNDEIPAVGDFNGDGLDDIVTFTSDSNAYVWVALSNGSSFDNARIWQPYFAPNDEIPVVGDFNGDGLDDIATFTSDSNGYVWVALSNGSSFGQASIWQTNFARDDEIPKTGDFNGDGKDDIVTFTSDSAADVWVSLSLYE